MRCVDGPVMLFCINSLRRLINAPEGNPRTTLANSYFQVRLGSPFNVDACVEKRI